MGVMSCSRKDCGNIMCDTYIQSIGYICSYCISEFKDYLEKNELNPKTEGQIINELEKFMQISKDNTSKKEMSVNEFFDIHSR